MYCGHQTISKDYKLQQTKDNCGSGTEVQTNTMLCRMAAVTGERENGEVEQCETEGDWETHV